MDVFLGSKYVNQGQVVPFGTLRGLELASVLREDLGEGREQLIFTSTRGRRFVMRHEQECSEDVRIEDLCGDLPDLVGTPILLAESVESDGGTTDKNTAFEEHRTWTFYKLSTVRGDVTIRWLGRSNGCYGEGVDLVEQTGVPLARWPDGTTAVRIWDPLRRKTDEERFALLVREPAVDAAILVKIQLQDGRSRGRAEIRTDPSRASKILAGKLLWLLQALRVGSPRRLQLFTIGADPNLLAEAYEHGRIPGVLAWEESLALPEMLGEPCPLAYPMPDLLQWTEEVASDPFPLDPFSPLRPPGDLDVG